MNRENIENVQQEFIVSGGYGWAFFVKKGQQVTITDLEGQQVTDFIAFASDSCNFNEHLSVSQTRSHLHRIYVNEGDQLLTNFREPIMEIVEDTVKLHDLTVECCDPERYEKLGLHEHRSCRQNFREVLEPYGIEDWRLPSPFNIFQNTKVDPNGDWFSDTPPSKAGDYITLRFLKDTLCVVSACPYDINGFNGGESTSIKVKVKS